MLKKMFKSNKKEFIEFIDFMSDAVFVMEVEAGVAFRYIAINKIGMEMTGLEETDIGKRIEDVLPMEEAAFLNQKYWEVVDNNSNVYFEHRTQDNRIGQSTLDAVLDNEGNTTHIISVTRDITAWKVAERELQEYKQKYKSIVDNNTDAIYELDLEGNIISMNEAVLEFAGYSREELINHSFVPLVSEIDLDRTLGHFKKAIEGAIQEYEIEIIHKEGHTFSCLIKNIPIIIDEQINGVFGIAKNITREKTLLNALKESEERHRRLVDTSPDPMFIHHEGFIEYANNAAVRLLEVSDSGQLIGKSIYDFSPIRYRDSIRERNREIIENDAEIISQEEEIVTVQGKKVDIEVTSISAIYKGRAVIHSVVRDISERKQLEEALRESEERYRHMAYHDQLTGLPNRHLFSDRLNQALVRAKRNQGQLAVMYLDCDHFKPINDELGHDAGDEFLKSLAGKLSDCIRESDTVARVGGDEFNILLPDIQNAEEVTTVAERILASTDLPWEWEGKPYRVSMSIGIAMYPKDGNDVKMLIKKADQALYMAKESGRNMYKVLE